MVAVLAVPMIGAVALATDASLWLLEQHRLQIAADAAAYSAAFQLSNTSMQSGAPGSYTTLVTNEANAAIGGSLVGKLGTPVVSAVSATSITVTLTSTADTYFAQVVLAGPITLTATATAGFGPLPACALALSPTAPNALDLGGTFGGGSLTANGCSVFADSSSSSAIYVNSASINASVNPNIIGSVGTHGGITKSSSGTNSISPTPVTGAPLDGDPVAGTYTLPAAGSCTAANTNVTDTAYKSTAYALVPGTYCGTTTIGGNGSTDTFAAGTYIFTGPVVINGANITQATGVTFIMLGATPDAPAGTFTWKNNSAATLAAPTSGAMNGLLLWQACPTGATAGYNGNGLIDFNGGSTLTASGTIYTPCGTAQFDNNAQVTATSGSGFSVVSDIINVWQGAALQVAASNNAASTNRISLTQ